MAGAHTGSGAASFVGPSIPFANMGGIPDAHGAGTGNYNALNPKISATCVADRPLVFSPFPGPRKVLFLVTLRTFSELAQIPVQRRSHRRLAATRTFLDSMDPLQNEIEAQ